MRLRWFTVLGLGLLASQASAGEPQLLKTRKEKASYLIGVDTARNIRQQGIDVDLDLVVKGLTDELSDEKLLMTDQELGAIRNATQREVIRKQAAQKRKQADTREMSADENKTAGEAFLAENKTKDGVVALPSGLQYKILKAGDGKVPTDADAVECHYRGTLIDGTEFGSSYRREQPASFKVTAVIPGWREALKLMPAGSKWQLFIPSRLAYGAKGAGPTIGPNATLVFELELLAIK